MGRLFFTGTPERAMPEKKYSSDFGNTELEAMAREFLAQNFSVFEKVEKAPAVKDLYEATDFIARIKGDGSLAIQFTSTDSPKRKFKAVQKILSIGYIRWEGERTPLVLLYAPKEIWGKAYNDFLDKNLTFPSEALPEPDNIKKAFLEQMEATLVLQAEMHRNEKHIFHDKLRFIQKEMGASEES